MSCCGGPSGDQAVKGTQEKGSVDVLYEDELIATAQPLDNDQYQSAFLVPKMHCIACIRSLEREIGALPFVENVRANLSMKKVTVTWQKGSGHIVRIAEAISDLGFEYSPFDFGASSNGLDDSGNRNAKQLLKALVVAGFAASNIMLLSVSIWSGADEETTKLFHLISGLIAVPAVFYSGQTFFSSAIGALKLKRLNMDVPISLAVLLALAMSVYESLVGGGQAYFDAAITLLFFLLIGRYLDNIMREKARNSVIQLGRLTSKGAVHVTSSGQLEYLELENIKPGMIIRVMAGERFGVDGEIIKGESDVDRSLVSGENVPVPVKGGAQIEAGTLNLTGVVDVKVTKDARHSFLAQISELVEAAEKGRDHYTRIADKMAQIYAPAVHLLAAAAFIGWMIASGGDWHHSIYIAISVLIITCPCAMGLAVPVVHVIAARRLLREGIIIRDGAAFERLEQVDFAVFDKTGTLTRAIPKVSSSTITLKNHKALAGKLASNSNHPYSKAVAQYFGSADDIKLSQIKEHPGAGIEALFFGKAVRLGNAAWVRKITADGRLEESDNGLAFGIEGELLARICITEQLRDGASNCIKELEKSGVAVAMLSGDNHKAVEAIAQKLGITDFQTALKPADKLSFIDRQHKAGKKVLMVGDGLNDSPALAAAHVSIAPAQACDIARQNADFVFTRDSLSAVPFAHHIAKRAGALVRQNFGLAIAYNCIAVPLAIAGFVTPLVAAIAMSASSIVVIANSMRLSIEKNSNENPDQIIAPPDAALNPEPSA